MKIKDYLKDKAYLIGTAIIFSFIMLMFLLAVDTNRQIIIVVLILFYVFCIIVLLVEYSRRKTYFDELLNTVDALDKKYLITEVLREPHFLDGCIFFEILRVVDKSMIDHVNEYKNSELDYKNYIEMWVHEIKTPLAASKLIISNNENEITKNIYEELEKVEGFVEQALFYARCASVEKDYLIKEMKLEEHINKVIRRNAKTFIYHDIKIKLHDLDICVYSDPKWIDFILNQIVSNSLKYTLEHTGELEIYAIKHTQKVELYIKDNGIGINAKDLPRIFDRAFTGSNGRNNEKATGMGLFLCKTLCKKLYLDIQAESNEGTTIIITFPLNSSRFMV